jgi:hypothetical protein
MASLKACSYFLGRVVAGFAVAPDGKPEGVQLRFGA